MRRRDFLGLAGAGCLAAAPAFAAADKILRLGAISGAGAITADLRSAES